MLLSLNMFDELKSCIFMGVFDAERREEQITRLKCPAYPALDS